MSAEQKDRETVRLADREKDLSRSHVLTLPQSLQEIRARLDKLEAAAPPPQRCNGHAMLLQTLPYNEVIEIDSRDQHSFLNAARKTGLCITTAKSRAGGMVLIKIRSNRPLRKCPKCGYSASTEH